jgi:hypothetical protein
MAKRYISAVTESWNIVGTHDFVESLTSPKSYSRLTCHGFEQCVTLLVLFFYGLNATKLIALDGDTLHKEA